MINTQDVAVVVIDIQEKLVNMLKDDVSEQIKEKSKKLISAAKTLGIDVLVTQQYSKGLGETIEPLKEILKEDFLPFEKTYFDALLEEDFLAKVKGLNKKQIVICGIESHICVYQTAKHLMQMGFEVVVAKDVCASRNKFEFKCAMDLLRQEGAKVSCLEIILFDWLGGAKNPKFKEVQALIK